MLDDRPPKTRTFGRIGASLPLPDLSDCQRRAYQRLFVPGEGFDALLREAFPIRSHEGNRALHYDRLELGDPEHDLDGCRRLGRSYTRPLFAWLRLEGTESICERVELAQVPIQFGGGEYLINGVERIVIAQLQRSPGIDFDAEDDPQDVSCRIMPERGCKVEIAISRRGTLETSLSPGVTMPALTLLRALSPDFSSDEAILAYLHPTHSRMPGADLAGAIVAQDVIDPTSGEVILAAGGPITNASVARMLECGHGPVRVLEGAVDDLLLASIEEDQPRTHEQALIHVYRLLRRGMPANLDRARLTLAEKFTSPAQYRLGRAGRFRIERKLGVGQAFQPDTLHTAGSASEGSVPARRASAGTQPNTLAGASGWDRQKCQAGKPDLQAIDLARAIRYLLGLRRGEGTLDDIDDLSNRRVRFVDELLVEEIRKNLFKMRRVVQDRMRKAEKKTIRPSDLVIARAFASAVEHFFARSELSQPADLTNPLAQLTHERRLTATGPGGVDRKRARFSVRDVHASHLGRICPIETPEGEAIGLVSHLALFADVDELGFLVTPYREVNASRIGAGMRLLRADEEVAIAPADILDGRNAIGQTLPAGKVMARTAGDFEPTDAAVVRHIAVSSAQQIGLSTALIPFLEHDDANRALMGSNMQRQAVPLLRPEAPLVGTGLEGEVARQSALVARAERDGVVTFVDAVRIDIDGVPHHLRKFGSSSGACLNQKPIVRIGDRVRARDVIADGPATAGGKLALGRNVVVAFMTWQGYNFEDAIVLSERLVREHVFTSIHLDSFECEVRDNRLGDEEFTARVPGARPAVLEHLGADGIVRIGAKVLPGDILVGKVVPRTRTEQTTEMRLLQALLGKGDDRVDDSLAVPAGVEGVVIATLRETSAERDLGNGVRERVRVTIASKRPIGVGDKMAGRHGNKGVVSKILPVEDMPYLADGTPVDILLNPLGVPSRMNVGQILETHLGWAASALGFEAITPVFDGASEREIRECLIEANLPANGKTVLYDGRIGERFDQPVTVGVLYMLKLHHLVDDKVHARATGPYSLITQQPLGGKARAGGQRLGEMEVWALEAYGASALLREMLTLKSDDVEGRARTYEALLRGDEPPEPGTPASVEVLRQELRGLGISLEWEEGEGKGDERE